MRSSVLFNLCFRVRSVRPSRALSLPKESNRQNINGLFAFVLYVALRKENFLENSHSVLFCLFFLTFSVFWDFFFFFLFKKKIFLSFAFYWFIIIIIFWQSFGRANVCKPWPKRFDVLAVSKTRSQAEWASSPETEQTATIRPSTNFWRLQFFESLTYAYFCRWDTM